MADGVNLNEFKYAGKRKAASERQKSQPKRGKVGEEKRVLPLHEECQEDAISAAKEKWFGFTDPKAATAVRRFQVLVAVLLSKQTHPSVLSSSMKSLVDQGLCVDYVLKIDEDELKDQIKSVHYNRQKASHIKSAAVAVSEAKEVPATHGELIKLPGIGPALAKILVNVLN
mmetsp:Transcript_34498/g.135717  ORF Transcript_34498/g.135717 Transcript_34498/m.135717 type:complete len:171 (-) Transcript_34498:1468-1980(-)